MQEELTQDLATLENEGKELRTQLASLDTQRQTLIARIQQVDGAAEDIAEEIAKEKSDEITEDNSEA